MKLSKTNYLVYRECKHNAWVKVHRPDVFKAKPLSAFDRNIIDAGNEVDVLARDLFPGGVLIDRGDAAGTRKLIDARTPILYQPVFETERFTTAADILVWNEDAQVYDLYEVKGSTSSDDKKANDELYTYDIAFQAHVLKDNDVPLGGLYLVRLNSDYVRESALDLGRLFLCEDFGDLVEVVWDAVAFEMDQAHDVLQSSSPLPGPCSCIYKGRSSHCTTFAFSNPNVPLYGVHDITRIGASKKKLSQLVDSGIFEIAHVPDDYPLSEAQSNQVTVHKTGRAMIDRDAISTFLAHLKYPIAFLDYETYPAAVPLFRGYGPYDQIPFQFSLDVIAAPDEQMVHHEFLHTTPDAPDRALIAALEAAMPTSGSVVTWNQFFERGINDKLARRSPEARDFLGDLDVRVVDLMDVFTTQAYVHPGFRGKTSIKWVLPVLVPSLSYKSLAIQEGATATARWAEVVLGGGSADAIAQLRTDLLAYCGLDTLAMVEIWRALLGEVEAARKAG